MLTLGVTLVVLAILGFIARAILRGLGAPAWLDSVLVGVILLVALIVVAQWAGIATPDLR